MTNFIANSADVFGRVTLGEGSTIWFQSVLRGDSNTISIGKMSNIQDGTIVHVDHDASTVIEDYVTFRCVDRNGSNRFEPRKDWEK